MKRSLFVVLILLPSLLFAGVIVKKNGERLEDINILSSANNEFVYIDELGVEQRLPKNEVSAVLYDDGRYEEIHQESDMTPALDEKVVEPQESAKAKKTKQADKEAVKEAKKNVKKMVVSAPEPAPAVEAAPVVAPVVAASAPVVETPAPKPTPAIETEPAIVKAVPTPTPAEADKKMIPKACKTEGQKAYDKVYKELVDKAVAKGYSKSQAYKMAYEAALKEKERVINECYHNVVELGEDFAPIPVVVPDILAPAADGSNPNQFTPRTCKEEGQKAYDSIYKEMLEKSMRQGYSKSQAYKIAYDTAVKEKNRVIEECQKNKATE